MVLVAASEILYTELFKTPFVNVKFVSVVKLAPKVTPLVLFIVKPVRAVTEAGIEIDPPLPL